MIVAESGKITKGLYDDISDLVRKSAEDPSFRPRASQHKKQLPGMVVPFMLLEDIESGEQAKAVRLTTGSAHTKYLLTASGLRDEDAEFRLIWGEETISEVSVSSTPVELRQRLLEFSFLSENDVYVQLGNHSRAVNSRGDIEEFNLYRWIVKLRPGLESLEMPAPSISTGEQIWMGIEKTQLEDSYELIRVRSLLPVGVDLYGNSPMQAGAIGLATYMQATERPAGWVIQSLEARNLTGDFLEIPDIDY